MRLAMLPPPPQPPAVDGFAVFNDVDRFIVDKWKRAGLPAAAAPPAVCDDVTFVRRAYLDLIGVVPTIEEARKFVDDPSTGKRAKLVDELLARADDYAAHWTPFFEEAIASSPFESQGSVRLHGNYQPWILDSFRTNRPYDVMAAQLVDPTEPGYVSRKPINVNGKVAQVGYVLNDTPKDTLQSAANFGQTFLGTGMKCASCHSHFDNDEWPQARFLAFAGMFGEKDLELVRCEEPSGQVVPAKFPFELPDAPTTMPSDVSARLHLAARLATDPTNPRFAKTAVNRLWKRYLGLGLFEPADDFRLNSPASHPELLEWLAHDFVAHGYDLKHTIRLILTSRTYQLRYDPALEDHFDVERRDEPRYYRSPSLRRLTAEQLLDSIGVAAAQKLDDRLRLYRTVESTALTRGLGRPPSRHEVTTARADDVAIVQALELLNGNDWASLVYRGGVVGELAAETDPAKVAGRLYRAALSRAPTAEELVIAVEFLRAAGDVPTTRPAPQEVVWVDDALPPGAVAGGSAGPESWQFVESPFPVHRGDRAHTQESDGRQVQHLFLGARPLVLESAEDVLFAHAWADASDPPKQIMLQWNDGTWDHRAYWGANVITFGTDGTPSRTGAGPLPEPGKWARLEVPAARVGFKGGSKIVGISFDQVGGRVYWDAVGVVKKPAADVPGAGDLLWALFTSPEFQYVR